MLNRAKKIAAIVAVELSRPAAMVALPQPLRGAIADLAGELVEINQRLDNLERKLNGKE